MFKESELIRSSEYWMDRIQNELYRAMRSYASDNDLDADEVSELLGISKDDLRKIENGEFDGSLRQMVDILIKLGKVPILAVRTFEEAEYRPLMERKGRDGKYFQMQDVLLACGDGLSQRELAPIRWLLAQANEMHEKYEQERRNNFK